MVQYNFYIQTKGYPEYDMVYSRAYKKDILRDELNELERSFLIDHILFFENFMDMSRKEIFDNTSVYMFELSR